MDLLSHLFSPVQEDVCQVSVAFSAACVLHRFGPLELGQALQEEVPPFATAATVRY
jgi:hypothetical protein